MLIPFPVATDDHPGIYARSMVEAGAAVMLEEKELSPQKLADTLRGLIGDKALLSRMEKASGLLGRPEAAKEITDVCSELVDRRWGHPLGREAAKAGLAR